MSQPHRTRMSAQHASAREHSMLRTLPAQVLHVRRRRLRGDHLLGNPNPDPNPNPTRTRTLRRALTLGPGWSVPGDSEEEGQAPNQAPHHAPNQAPNQPALSTSGKEAAAPKAPKAAKVPKVPKVGIGLGRGLGLGPGLALALGLGLGS